MVTTAYDLAVERFDTGALPTKRTGASGHTVEDGTYLEDVWTFLCALVV